MMELQLDIRKLANYSSLARSNYGHNQPTVEYSDLIKNLVSKP